MDDFETGKTRASDHAYHHIQSPCLEKTESLLTKDSKSPLLRKQQQHLLYLKQQLLQQKQLQNQQKQQHSKFSFYQNVDHVFRHDTNSKMTSKIKLDDVRKAEPCKDEKGGQVLGMNFSKTETAPISQVYKESDTCSPTGMRSIFEGVEMEKVSKEGRVGSVREGRLEITSSDNCSTDSEFEQNKLFSLNASEVTLMHKQQHTTYQRRNTDQSPQTTYHRHKNFDESPHTTHQPKNTDESKSHCGTFVKKCINLREKPSENNINTYELDELISQLDRSNAASKLEDSTPKLEDTSPRLLNSTPKFGEADKACTSSDDYGETSEVSTDSEESSVCSKKVHNIDLLFERLKLNGDLLAVLEGSPCKTGAITRDNTMPTFEWELPPDTSFGSLDRNFTLNPHDVIYAQKYAHLKSHDAASPIRQSPKNDLRASLSSLSHHLSTGEVSVG